MAQRVDDSHRYENIDVKYCWGKKKKKHSLKTKYDPNPTWDAWLTNTTNIWPVLNQVEHPFIDFTAL